MIITEFIASNGCNKTKQNKKKGGGGEFLKLFIFQRKKNGKK